MRRAAWNLARRPAHARSACSRAAQTARLDTAKSAQGRFRADGARALSHAATDGRVPPVRGVFNLPPPLR